MGEKIKLEPSEELGYWIGVAQSDGCLTKYKVKRWRSEKQETRVELSIHASHASLPMIEKFQDISGRFFDRHAQIWRGKKRDEWYIHIMVKSLSHIFKQLDIKFSPFFLPPTWTLQEPRYFGAYLAGLIDGDGDITVKRPEYPQCAIAISSGTHQDFLSEVIKKILGCGVHQSRSHKISFMKRSGKFIEGTSYRLEFYVSKKTAKFISDFVIPYLQLDYKRRKLEDFIDKRQSPLN